MAIARHIVSPDVIELQAHFGVEVIDPVTFSILSDGVRVVAEGLTREPRVNRSGRFVWMSDGSRWPTLIRVTCAGLPFADHVAAAPARPNPLATRLARVILRPSPAYPFEHGVTVVRGQLRERVNANSKVIDNARVQLAWFDDQSETWLPAAPTSSPDAPLSPSETETDSRGEFAAFLRLQPARGARPDFQGRLLKVRLQFTRNTPALTTRVTPDTFVFVPGAASSRVPEGQLLAADIKLSWDKLTPLPARV